MSKIKKIGGIFAAIALLVSSFAFAVPAQAVAPSWNTSGSYIVDMEYLGSHYNHDMTLNQDSSGTLTGNGGSPAGANTYTWVITSGSVSGNNIDFMANYTATADAVTPQTTLHMMGTIGSGGAMSGTWNDNYQGGERSGTWSTTSGMAVPVSASLEAQDFGVVNYDTGLGMLKGYTAGFGVNNGTLAGAQSVVVKLYSGSTLLQTNTAILPKFNADITGTQFSSPFDVSGNFNYATDGYWTNVRSSQYGQSMPATKVVATVTLSNGQVVTAQNTNLTGDPTSIYPESTPVNPPTDKEQCKKDGWKTFTDPTFKNQGDCEKYVKDNDENGKAKGEITLSNPDQKINFEVTSKDGKKDKEDKDKGNIEYWNYDYNGGTLHYKAKALCVAVNSDTNVARFMYQIPAGYPGLSELYIVASAMDGGKHGTGDTFSFASSSDLTTATNMCNNGGSFTAYSITKGDIKVK